MKLCDESSCTGCMACVNACASGALKVEIDAEGFLRPQLIRERCIECGKCEKVCPQIHQLKESTEKFEKKVYACWHKNKKIKKDSTSGGAFSTLAENILEEGGIVYGAGFDPEFKVIHKAIADKERLEQLRGSKYVQSEIGDSYRQVKKYLKTGKKVLFSGTPCQIAGLYSYLGDRFSGQLYTVDLVCHGVPSPMVYQDYLNYMKKRYQSPVKKISFRDKKRGWFNFSMSIEFMNGVCHSQSTYENPYIRGFLRELFLRPSCHQCLYANTERVADLTLADFWGYENRGIRDRDNDTGISMVMINTKYGDNLFWKVSDKLRYYERSVEDAIKGNQALRKCFSPSSVRKEFWKDYKIKGFDGVMEQYMYPDKVPVSVRFRKVVLLIPKGVKVILRRSIVHYVPK